MQRADYFTMYAQVLIQLCCSSQRLREEDLTETVDLVNMSRFQ